MLDTRVECHLPIVNGSLNIARNAFRHIISGNFWKLCLYRVMGRFSDVVCYDLSVTFRMSRFHSKVSYAKKSLYGRVAVVCFFRWEKW